MKNSVIPGYLQTLFWEYDIESIDLRRHGQFVMTRIMEQGSWAAEQWLKEKYSKKALRDFLRQRGKMVLPLRELNYWALICGIPKRTRQEWMTMRKVAKNIWTERHAPRHS